jgi:ribosome-associated heat shock protein Hsp15
MAAAHRRDGYTRLQCADGSPELELEAGGGQAAIHQVAGIPSKEVRLGAACECVSHYSCRVTGDQAGRVDSWIWSVRLTRTRSAASVACRAGHVRVNGVRVKPAHAVRAGDEVRLRAEGRERVVVVQQVIAKRVSASAAAACYIDNSPPPPPREEAVPVAARDRGAGRPTKRERRSIDKLLGRPTR